MIYEEMPTIPLPKYIFRFQKSISSTTSEAIQSDLLILNAFRLFTGINSRRYSYIRHKYFGTTTAIKPTYANLKAELLQSDKNQVTIHDETASVNVVTSSIPVSQPYLSHSPQRSHRQTNEIPSSIHIV